MDQSMVIFKDIRIRKNVELSSKQYRLAKMHRYMYTGRTGTKLMAQLFNNWPLWYNCTLSVKQNHFFFLHFIESPEMQEHGNIQRLLSKPLIWPSVCSSNQETIYLYREVCSGTFHTPVVLILKGPYRVHLMLGWSVSESLWRDQFPKYLTDCNETLYMYRCS